MAASPLHRTIAEKATRLIMRLHGCTLGAVEFTGGGGLGESVDGLVVSSSAVYVIEAKVSRADFLADKKKPHRADPNLALGQYRYYACPEGMIKPEELPEKWGLIYVNERGHCSMPVGYGTSVKIGERPVEGRSWGEPILKRYGSWEKITMPPDNWHPEPYEINRHTVDGVEARDYFRFEGNANVERAYLYALASRYKSQKFMANIL